jgi:glycosyltransferase involved in cell wall biosynthesis
MRVFFIVENSIPLPNASSNRKISLVKALNFAGAEAEILCIMGTYGKKDTVTESSEIRVSYTTSKFRHDSFIVRNLNKVKGRLNSFLYIYKENKKNKIDAVFLPAKLKMLFYIMFFYLFSRLLGIKILFEVSEYPEILVRSKLTRIYYYIHKLFTVKLFDGAVVMTNNLNSYFSKLLSKKAKIITIPMTVDMDRFKLERDPVQIEKYIAYSGYISNKKDGVDILIRSFAAIAAGYPEYKLYIIGGTNEKGLIESLKSLCADLGIKEKVVFTGKVDNNEIPKLIVNASILALARPSSLQAQGGFPTKLGEYLSTKNPVVLTDVGEIKNYLIDGVSAYISEPDSVEAFSKKLEECLSDKEKASEIGINGYKVALNNFNYKSKAFALKDFLLNLYGSEEPKKIAIVTQAPFPAGLASTNRVIYHAKGLIANGVDAKVFVSWPTERIGSSRNPDPEGQYNGVPFEYADIRNIRSTNFFGRRIHDIFGPVKMANKIIRENNDAVVMISWNSFYLVNLLKIIFMFSKIKLVAERTELPFHSKKTDGIHRYKNKLILLYAYKWLYGFLVISKELKKIFEPLVSKKCPIALIPVIIDERDIYRPEVKRTDDLVYTGPLLQYKDGILTIIEAFTKIAAEFPNTNLIMTGNIDKSADKNRILEMIESSGLKHRMKLTGFISREEMIGYLNSAAALLMAKPLSEQADTCFPSKLGEYLSTGNPIVVTDTGEISFYLKDGYDAYIAAPGSLESYTDKLKELLNDRERARMIGERGRETVIKKFNFKETALKIVTLLENKKKYSETYADR